MNDRAWFDNRIISGIQWLATLRLRGTPADDVLAATAKAWIATLWATRLAWEQERDERRIGKAFMALASTCDFWPAPRQLIDALPAVEEVPALPPPKTLPTPDRRAKLLSVRNDLALKLTTVPIKRGNEESAQ